MVREGRCFHTLSLAKDEWGAKEEMSSQEEVVYASLIQITHFPLSWKLDS